MNWLFLSAAALGAAAAALLRHTSWLEHLLGPAAEPGVPAPTLRKSTPLDRMIAALKHEPDPLERHRLLSRIVDESHRRRSETAMKKLFLRFAAMHVQELPKMAAGLKAAGGGRRPVVPTLALLAAALEEDGRIAEALSVCEQAVELGLTDGTRVGFAGRIRRLRKQVKDAAPPAQRSLPRAAGSRSRRPRKP
jgi:hypothetical protein